MIIDCEKYIYKVTSKQHWENSLQKGELKPMEIDIKDGYLHFSTIKQLRETLRLYFSNQKNLMLLGVKITDFEHIIKWEKSRNNELFPHIYGVVDIGLVEIIEPISVNEIGKANLPDFIKC